MRRWIIWPVVATVGAAMVIYAEATYPGMTLGGRIATSVAAAALPAITWFAAYRRSHG